MPLGPDAVVCAKLDSDITANPAEIQASILVLSKRGLFVFIAGFEYFLVHRADRYRHHPVTNLTAL
jgi:hypothetical protein